MANRTKPFTLDILTPHLKNFTPPQGSFNPDKDWQHSYRVLTLAGRGGEAGTLHLRRRNAKKESFLLDVFYLKFLPKPYRHDTEGLMNCKMNALSTPTAWHFVFSTSYPENKNRPNFPQKRNAEKGEIYIDYFKTDPNSSMARQAANYGKEIRYQDGSGTHSIPKPQAYTINWALFDVVQRLPRKQGQTLSFTLLDHFDQVKPNHTLTYHGEQEIIINNTTLRLHRFDQLGEGIVPWVYWVDQTGRLLFVVSGIEAYILAST
jgi:hypothetical protein